MHLYRYALLQNPSDIEISAAVAVAVVAAAAADIDDDDDDDDDAVAAADNTAAEVPRCHDGFRFQSAYH